MDAKEFKDVIEDIVDSELDNRGITKYVSAIISNVNDKNYVDVYIPPDKDKIVTGIPNKTGEELFIGDSVELCTKNGKIKNSWVAFKHGQSKIDTPLFREIINLENYSTSNFYPVTFNSEFLFSDIEIHSPSLSSSASYNQNVIHFRMDSHGWNDTPASLEIFSYGAYDANEITIGCIGRGTHDGTNCVWLRGGMKYTVITNVVLYPWKNNYIYGDEVFSVGTNYYGGTNTNVEIVFTPKGVSTGSGTILLDQGQKSSFNLNNMRSTCTLFANSNCLNKPVSGSGYAMAIANDSTNYLQFFTTLDGTETYKRARINGNWTTWELLDGNVYSTDEKKVGKWDGKPLYRKTITHTITGSTQEREPIGESNIQYVTSVEGWMLNQYGYYISTKSSNFIELYSTTSDVLITSANMRGKVSITIEYTKTTD